MPLKDGRLTVKEETFAERFAATGDATYAAEKAGYSQPEMRGWQKKNDPAIQDNVRRRLAVNLAKAAVDVPGVLHGILISQKARDADRINAGKAIMGALTAYTDASGDKELHEMTSAEITRALSEAFDKMRVIEGESAQAVRNDDDIFQ